MNLGILYATFDFLALVVVPSFELVGATVKVLYYFVLTSNNCFRLRCYYVSIVDSSSVILIDGEAFYT